MAMIVREFEGRNEKEAIDKAIEELGLDRNEIDFEIVESRKAGILFRGGKVKIRVHVSDGGRGAPPAPPAPEAPGGRRGPGAQKGPGADHDLHDEDAKAEAAARQRHGQLSADQPPRHLDEQALEAAVLYGDKTPGRGPARDEGRGDGRGRRGGRREGRSGRRPDGRAEPRAEPRAENRGEGRGEGRRSEARPEYRDGDRRGPEHAPAVPETPHVPKPPATGDPLEHEQEIVGFVQGVLERMSMTATVVVTAREPKRLELEVETDRSGALIGKQGKTLEAFQFLANLAASRFGADSMRVIIDTQDYRARREHALERMANQAADRVRRNRDSTLMEPLNPFERRIVHTALAKRGDVETISEGEGLYKRIRVIWRGSRDGGGARDAGRDGGRGGGRDSGRGPSGRGRRGGRGRDRDGAVGVDHDAGRDSSRETAEFHESDFQRGPAPESDAEETDAEGGAEGAGDGSDSGGEE